MKIFIQPAAPAKVQVLPCMNIFVFNILSPDASIINLVLSYFKDVVLDVFKKGFERVQVFCFGVNAELIQFRITYGLSA